MPLSGSYFYPGMHRPPATQKLTEISVSEVVTLTSGSAAVILSSSDVSAWSNIAVTLNNAGAGSLGTVALEFSPDDVNWEEWDTSTFSSLASGTVLSMQIAGNSRKYFRVRSTDTPADAAVTASLDMNNG